MTKGKTKLLCAMTALDALNQNGPRDIYILSIDAFFRAVAARKPKQTTLAICLSADAFWRRAPIIEIFTNAVAVLYLLYTL